MSDEKVVNILEEQISENELFDKFSRTYEAEEVIFCEYEPGKEAFVIISGQVKISLIVKAQEKVLALLGPGDIIGEMAIIDNKPRSATAITTEKTQVIVLTKENFELILAKKPLFLVKLIQILCKRIWFTSKQIRSLLMKSAAARVSSMLVLLGEARRKKADQLNDIFIYTSPKDLSQMAGLELEETDKLLREFENKEILKIEEGVIIIKNLKDLRTAMEFYLKKENFKHFS